MTRKYNIGEIRIWMLVMTIVVQTASAVLDTTCQTEINSLCGTIRLPTGDDIQLVPAPPRNIIPTPLAQLVTNREQSFVCVLPSVTSTSSATEKTSTEELLTTTNNLGETTTTEGYPTTNNEEEKTTKEGQTTTSNTGAITTIEGRTTTSNIGDKTTKEGPTTTSNIGDKTTEEGPTTTSNIVVTTNSSTNGSCPDNFVAFAENCYFFHLPTEVSASYMTESEAASFCFQNVSTGTYNYPSLLTIQSLQENTFIRDYIINLHSGSIDTDGVWVDCELEDEDDYDCSKEYGYSFLDLNSTSDAWGMVGVGLLSGDACVNVDLLTGSWYSKDCNEKALVVCQFTPYMLLHP